MALTDNLISFWELEEASGTRVDKREPANNLSVTSVGQNTGKVGNCAEFPGQGAHLIHDDNSSLRTGTSNTTWCAWVYMYAKEAQDMEILSKATRDDQTHAGYNMDYTPSFDRFSFWWWQVGGAQAHGATADNFGSPSINTWYFIMAGYIASTTDSWISVNNGTENVFGPEIGVPGDDSTPFRIGSYSDPARYWKGRIDQVGFWKRTLTTTEKSFLYNSGSGRTFSAINAEPGLNSSLISFWELEEASGTRVDSVTASANDLTDDSTPTQNTGKVGNCGHFALGNVQHADSTELRTGDIDQAFCAWVYLDSKAPGGMGIVAKLINSGGPGFYFFYSLTSDRFRFLLTTSSGTDAARVTATTFGSPSLATWYFIVGQFNAATDTASISVNNGTVDTAAQVGTAASDATPFTIGSSSSPNAFFHGRVDQVGFWKRVLTATEITFLYNGGAGRTYEQIMYEGDRPVFDLSRVQALIPQVSPPWQRTAAWMPRRYLIPPEFIPPFPGWRIPPQDPPWKLEGSWRSLNLITLQTLHPRTVSASLSTVLAVPTTGIPNDGLENATIFITMRYDDGTPIEGLLVVISATGANIITQPGATDANGRTLGYVASTEIGIKTVTVSVGALVLDQQPIIEFRFITPLVAPRPPQGNGLQADTANGRWYRVLENETPLLTSSQFGPTTRPYTFLDAPAQLSRSRQTAWRWQVDTAGVFSVRQVPISQATIPYIEFISPLGVSFVLELNDAGVESLVAFPERLRVAQPLALASQPGVVYIADTRFPLPKGVTPR